MSIQSKLSARLRSDYRHTKGCIEAYAPRGRMDPDCLACEIDVLAGEIEAGQYDDVLGVPEPTFDDGRREAVRVYGKDAEFGLTGEHYIVLANPREHGPNARSRYVPVVAPTIAAAYQALKALPDYKE